MSIGTATRYIEDWHNAKNTELTQEELAVNHVLSNFVAFLALDKDHPKQRVSKVLLDTALKAAVDAVPGGVFLTDGFGAAVKSVGILTEQGQKLAELAVEKGYQAAIKFTHDIKNGSTQDSHHHQVKPTKSAFIDAYFQKRWDRLNNEIWEVELVSRAWNQILDHWTPKMGDPDPLVRNALGPLLDIPRVRNQLHLFPHVASYFLIGAYVKEYVVVDKDLYRHTTNVKGLNHTQLNQIYEDFGAASAAPRRLSVEASRELAYFRHSIDAIKTQFIDCFISTQHLNHRHLKAFFKTQLKEINNPNDLVTVWGAQLRYKPYGILIDGQTPVGLPL